MMMKAARASETLVNFYQSKQRCSPEDTHLRTHLRGNLNSYKASVTSDGRNVQYIIPVMNKRDSGQTRPAS